MNKKARIGLVATLITLAAAGAGAHHAWREGLIPTSMLAAHPSAPLPENFLAVLKADASTTQHLDPECLRVELNSGRRMDRNSRAGMSYQPYPGWDVISIAQVPSEDGHRVSQLTKALDALAKARLYADNVTEAIDEAGVRYKMKHYALTLTGWKHMSEERCFKAGMPTPSEILEFSRVLSDSGAGDLYEVKAAYKRTELAPWARDKGVQSLVSPTQSKALLNPVTITTRLRRTDTGWLVESLPPAFPVLDDDEALELITSARRFAPPEACIRLPADASAAGVVVQAAPYTVTLYEPDPQSGYGASLVNRLQWKARMDVLAGAGVFQTEEVAADRSQGTPAGTRYLLEPDYQQWLDMNDAQCLRMGTVTTEMLDLTLKPEPEHNGREGLAARGMAKLLSRLDESAWIRSMEVHLPEVDAVLSVDGVPAVAHLTWSDRDKESVWQFVGLQSPQVYLTPSPALVEEAKNRMLAAEQMATERDTRSAGAASNISSAVALTSAAHGDVGWRPAHRGNGGGVSNAGLTATYCCAGASSAALSTRSVASGKVYAEFTLKTRPLGKTGDTYTSIGVVPGSVLDAAGDIFILNTDAAAMAFRRGDEIGNNDVIGLAIDLDRGQLHVSRNGAWLSSAPGAVGGMPLKPGRPQYVAAVISASSASGGTDSWTANFGRTRFRYPIPPGYKSYDGRQGG